ncbi:UV-stimulated scaffold protein A-like isoform X1 [Sycon ciliatum]|uniref:UV-stimulated scaffold protein A-like isoform X1 n=1 Tax=Sycon ciliatum TaxID=27933 RepID=UPI0031F67C31
MDIGIHRELCQLVEDITTSGCASLDEKKCKAIKNICKKSDVYVNAVFTLLMDQLEREHAQIRLSCLLLIDQLFCRSHAFRTLMVTDLHKIMTYCMGTDVAIPLPRPKDVAETMKRRSLKCFSEWHQRFGEHYKKLALGYSYLQKTKKVDFANLEAQSNQERRRADAEAERRQIILQRKLDHVKAQMNEMIVDMESCITEMESCFQLLLPSVAEFEPAVQTRGSTTSAGKTPKSRTVNAQCASTAQPPLAAAHGSSAAEDVPAETTSAVCNSQTRTGLRTRSSSSADRAEAAEPGHANADRMCRTVSVSSADVDNFEEWEYEEEDVADASSVDEDGTLRAQGMANNYCLTLDARSLTMAGGGGYIIAEDADNSDLLTTLADNRRLIIRKFLPVTAAWLVVLTKSADKEGERLRRVMDCRMQMNASVDKFSELKVEWRDRSSSSQRNADAGGESSEEDDEDVEFEEVPEKEGLEMAVVDDPELDAALVASRRSAQADDSKRPSKASSAAAPLVSSWSMSTVHEDQKAIDPTTMAAQLSTLSRGEKKSTAADDSFPANPDSSFSSTTTTAAAAAAATTTDLLSVAPKVRFDTDILNWGVDGDAPPSIVKLDSLHRFWNNADTEPEFVNKDLWESANQRSILFTGKFEPVKWMCRVPLPSGKLCPRKDRVKCPFHGPIIARDNQGRPDTTGQTGDEDNAGQSSLDKNKSAAAAASSAGTSSSTTAAPRAAWLDLEADVAAAVGVPEMQAKPPRKKRKAVAKESTLADLDADVNTPKSRIAKRIFSKGAINRVSANLDAIATKRGEDRFGNQWNYSFGTSSN